MKHASANDGKRMPRSASTSSSRVPSANVRDTPGACRGIPYNSTQIVIATREPTARVAAARPRRTNCPNRSENGRDRPYANRADRDRSVSYSLTAPAEVTTTHSEVTVETTLDGFLAQRRTQVFEVSTQLADFSREVRPGLQADCEMPARRALHCRRLSVAAGRTSTGRQQVPR